MTPIILLTAMLIADGDAHCRSTAECNRLGTQALAEGRIDDARRLFASQIDHADTALDIDDESVDRSRLFHARSIALNNAALTELRAGKCLMARAWLDIADAEHKATIANRRQLAKRCGDAASGREMTGEYRQYVGHGMWNRVSVRATGDETLRLDAFWIRISRGPLEEYGLAAFGELEQVYLHIDEDRGRGLYQGLDPEHDCHLDVRFVPGGLDITRADAETCQVGGAGAVLAGRYWRVDDETPLPDDEGP